LVGAAVVGNADGSDDGSELGALVGSLDESDVGMLLGSLSLSLLVSLLPPPQPQQA
jgi:hypothetical protein